MAQSLWILWIQTNQNSSDIARKRVLEAIQCCNTCPRQKQKWSKSVINRPSTTNISGDTFCTRCNQSTWRNPTPWLHILQYITYGTKLRQSLFNNTRVTNPFQSAGALDEIFFVPPRTLPKTSFNPRGSGKLWPNIFQLLQNLTNPRPNPNS